MRPVAEGLDEPCAVGSAIGPYQVLDTIEASGFDQAFVVFNTNEQRQEIMRIAPRTSLGADLAVQRFLTEGRILRLLEHPNLPKVYELIETPENCILTMEFNDGTPLDRLLETEPPCLADGLRYVADVLAGLECAHNAKVVHRCIAPTNIRILADGRAQLHGFTNALRADDVRLTTRGFAIGFVRYMSPEQVQGRRDLDARSDLYSLSVVLYELITGQRPFPFKNQFQLMQAHLSHTFEPPSSRKAGIPPELDSILLKGLAKDPDSRFQSAHEFRSALAEV